MKYHQIFIIYEDIYNVHYASSSIFNITSSLTLQVLGLCEMNTSSREGSTDYLCIRMFLEMPWVKYLRRLWFLIKDTENPQVRALNLHREHVYAFLSIVFLVLYVPAIVEQTVLISLGFHPSLPWKETPISFDEETV